MRFIVRSIFWLSIVYASILSPKHVLQVREGASDFRSSISSVGSLAEAAAACRGHKAAGCLDDAARLTEMLAKVTSGGDQMAALSRDGGTASGGRGRRDGLTRAR